MNNSNPYQEKKPNYFGIEDNLNTRKYFRYGGIAIIIIFSLFILNKLTGYNTSGYRTVIESLTGNVSVKFTPGFYFQGFGKTTVYPDIVTVNYTKDAAGSTIDIEPITIRFNDATAGEAQGISKFILPKDEKLMIIIHQDYRSVENLGLTGLKPYVTECLKNSSQLMSSEMHYLGGRSTMSQYFQDQLETGVYILKTVDKNIWDSIEKENKRIYITEIQRNANGIPIQKKSITGMYKIGVSDAVISDVDYEDRVDKMLGKKIDAQTQTSISKQKLMQAQQEALTAEAEGKKKLVQIEYEEKQNQTKSVISAQTEVELAKQDKLKQQIAYEGAILEGKKIKELAEAHAYEKKSNMIADGALEMRLKYNLEVQKVWSMAYQECKQPLVPTQYISGGTGTPPNAMEVMSRIMLMNQYNQGK